MSYVVLFIHSNDVLFLAIKYAFKKGHSEILEYFLKIETEGKFNLNELLLNLSNKDLQIICETQIEES